MLHEKNIRGMLSEGSECLYGWPRSVPSAIYPQLKSKPSSRTTATAEIYRSARRSFQRRPVIVAARKAGERKFAKRGKKREEKSYARHKRAQRSREIAPYCAILRNERKGRRSSRSSLFDHALHIVTILRIRDQHPRRRDTVSCGSRNEIYTTEPPPAGLTIKVSSQLHEESRMCHICTYVSTIILRLRTHLLLIAGHKTR